MPTAREVSDRFRQALLAREQAMTEGLIRSYANTYGRLNNMIGALEGEILKLPIEQQKAWQIMRLGRWKAMKQQIASELDRYGAVVWDAAQNAHRESITAGLDFAYESMAAKVPPELLSRVLPLWHRFDPNAVETALGYFTPESPLYARLQALAPNGAQVVEDALTQAITLGYNPRKWAGAVSKSLGQPLPWALNMARTAQLQAYRQATLASYKRNEHVVRGWEWQATYDNRVCMSCLAQDGTFHSLDEELDDHHQGRCVPVCVTRSWQDLGFDIEEPIEERQNGRDWFEGLDGDAQRAMFRNNKLYDAWKGGTVDWAQLSRESIDEVWRRMLTQQSYVGIFGEE